MGIELSRRELLAASGAGIAGMGAFAYADPLDIGLLSSGGSTGDYFELVGEETQGIGDAYGWNHLFCLDGTRMTELTDNVSDETANWLSMGPRVPGEIYQSAITVDTGIAEYNPTGGVALVGTVDVDRLLDADLPDPQMRKLLRHNGYSPESELTHVETHHGVDIYRKAFTVSTPDRVIHKAIAISEDYFVISRRREKPTTAVEYVKSVLETGMDDSPLSERNETFGTFRSLLNGGAVGSVSASPDQPTGATLRFDGETTIHREVTFVYESATDACMDGFEQTVEDYYRQIGDENPFDSVTAGTTDGAVVIEGRMPTAKVKPTYEEPFLTNKGAIMHHVQSNC